MKKRIVSYSLLIGVLLMFSGLSYARTDGDVKSSPLFQVSLEETVGSMDANSSPGQGVEVAMATQGQYCGIPTFSPTCEPTICSEPSCTMTTYYTVCSTTCRNTCATCYNTCTNTCSSCQQDYHFDGYAYWYYYGYAGSNWGHDGLGQLGIEPRKISVYVDYGDGLRHSGGMEINYSNSYYIGTDKRTTYSGNYYVDGGGFCEPLGDIYNFWSVSGASGWHPLQASNRTDFYINVAP